MQDNFEVSRDIAQAVVDHLLETDVIGNEPKGYGGPRQTHTGIHPIISNGMYKRENEIKASINMKTLITLARTLDDVNLDKAIEALGYQINVNEKSTK